MPKRTNDDIINGESSLWMRSVSFVALRETFAIIAAHKNGLAPKEIDRHIKGLEIVKTQNNHPPSRTTLFHYRNTLYHLGMITRIKGRYYVNLLNDSSEKLIKVGKQGNPTLTDEERKILAESVIKNVDCRKNFFDFFMDLNEEEYDLNEFLLRGKRAAWFEQPIPKGRRVRIYSLDGIFERWLSTENEFQAILYGVRYWARTELQIIDEIYLEDRGGVMFPTKIDKNERKEKIIEHILEELAHEDWTILSLREIAYRIAPIHKVPIVIFYDVIKELHYRFPQHVIFIPTSQSFATITASLPDAVKYQLRSYLKDDNGNYISHIRMHKMIKESFYGTK